MCFAKCLFIENIVTDFISDDDDDDDENNYDSNDIDIIIIIPTNISFNLSSTMISL